MEGENKKDELILSEKDEQILKENPSSENFANSEESIKQRRFKRIEDLTDSEEEYHPNVCTRSFNKFLKEENRKRLEELRNKTKLTKEEKEEKEKLEYKFLPVDIEIPENSFRVSKEVDSEESNTDDLIYLFNNCTVDNVIRVLDNNVTNIEQFEDLIYLNLSNAIKEGNDDIGYEFCKLGLLVKWAREYGRNYLVKIREYPESRLEPLFKSHYEASKDALLRLPNRQ